MTLPKIAVKTYSVKLPICNKTIKIRPFTVKEQKTLLMTATEVGEEVTGESRSHLISNFLEVLQSCVHGNHDLTTLTVTDFIFLMVKLREFSVGEDIKLAYKCPCGESVTPVMSLKSIKVKNIKKGSDYEKELKITPEVVIKLRPPTVKESMMMTEVKDENDLSVTILASCIKEISDSETVYDTSEYTIKELNEFVDGFPVEKLKDIQQYFESLPYPYIKITAECPDPAGKIDVEVKDIFDFF